MVRLAALVLTAGLAAGKTVDLAPSAASSTAHGPLTGLQGQQALQHAPQKVFNTQPAAKHAEPRPLPASINRDGSHHHSDYSQPSGGYSLSGGGYGHSGGGYSSSGGYSQPSYSDYGSDSYGYTEATTYENGNGGFLGGIGKYGFIIIPILLGITLLFLFPSVINVASSARSNRALGDQDDPSDDVISRLMTIYTSISEEPLCVNRMFCELGSAVGSTPLANRILQYIDYFYSGKSDNVLVLKKAAQAEDPQCHLLACKAWENKSAATKRQSSQSRKAKSTE